MGGTPSKRMLMLIMQLPAGSSKYRICPFITEKTVLSGNYIQVDIDKLCRVRATTQCAFGVSWSNPRAVGLVQKNCIFSPWVLLLTQELNLSHLLSLLRARYITQQVRVRGRMDPFIHECMNAWMMRTACTIDGERMFDRTEWLSNIQIQGFFSRLCPQ